MDYSTRIFLSILVLLLSHTSLLGYPTSKPDSLSTQMLNVFMDCEDCDFNYMREEVQPAMGVCPRPDICFTISP